MSPRDDVPDWAPRPDADTGGPDVPYAFLGGSSPSPPPPPEAAPAPGRGRAAGGGRRGGAHAGRGTSRPRRRRPRLLLGPPAAALVLVLLSGFGVYAFASASGGSCADAPAVTLDVAAAPSIAPAVTAAARRFDEAGHRVAGRCVRARVRAADPAAVATLLSGRGRAGVSRRPDMWIPDSSLWIKLIEGTADAPGTGRSAGAGGAVPITRLGGMAVSPIVLAVPRPLADRLHRGGPHAWPSWTDLLRAAGTAAPDAGAVPPGLLRLQVPDPNRSATGMGALMLADALLERAPGGDARFTGVARTLREGVAVSVEAQFAAFRADREEPFPAALAPEQAVRTYNTARGADGAAAVAVYPAEGTVFLDYPVTVLAGDPAGRAAARLLHGELTSRETRDAVLRLGFRTSDGTAPASFAAAGGALDPRTPHSLATPPPAEVARTMQAWAQLSLRIRMLSVMDVSGSMAEEVAPGVTRLQSTIRTAQGGLSLLPDDSELGQWVFATDLADGRDWRELVGVGPLDERLGSATRRQRVLSAFARMRVRKGAGTGLYDTVMAAFSHMTGTYKPEFVNSILLWTDGRDEDAEGPSLAETLDFLRAEYDPRRPVQIFMLGFGEDVDVAALRRIAELTGGDVFVADTPGEIQRIFLEAISRRVCLPGADASCRP